MIAGFSYTTYKKWSYCMNDCKGEDYSLKCYTTLDKPICVWYQIMNKDYNNIGNKKHLPTFDQSILEHIMEYKK